MKAFQVKGRGGAGEGREQVRILSAFAPGPQPWPLAVPSGQHQLASTGLLEAQAAHPVSREHLQKEVALRSCESRLKVYIHINPRNLQRGPAETKKWSIFSTTPPSHHVSATWGRSGELWSLLGYPQHHIWACSVGLC